jgi:hypothetical protein
MTDTASIISAGSSVTTTIIAMTYIIYKICQGHHFSFHSKCSKCCEIDINDVQSITENDIQQPQNITVNVNTPSPSNDKSSTVNTHIDPIRIPTDTNILE